MSASSLGGERDDFEHEMNKLPIMRKHVGERSARSSSISYLSLRKERSRLLRTAPPALDQALVRQGSGPEAARTRSS